MKILFKINSSALRFDGFKKTDYQNRCLCSKPLYNGYYTTLYNEYLSLIRNYNDFYIIFYNIDKIQQIKYNNFYIPIDNKKCH